VNVTGYPASSAIVAGARTSVLRIMLSNESYSYSAGSNSVGYSAKGETVTVDGAPQSITVSYSVKSGGPGMSSPASSNELGYVIGAVAVIVVVSLLLFLLVLRRRHKKEPTEAAPNRPA
jgi:flagellar biosynthesis/type III secretory pathway M-ring protein FliF/YscJ